MQATWPHLGFEVDNRGAGGANSRDIAEIVREAVAEQRYDVAFLGCGINDVWRGFQGRTAEAVDRAEFTVHYTAMLEALTARSRTVICISETPFGPIDDAGTVAEMNLELARYNDIAARAAAQASAHSSTYGERSPRRTDSWRPPHPRPLPAACGATVSTCPTSVTH